MRASRKLRFQSSWTTAERLIIGWHNVWRSEFPENRSQSGRPQVICQEVIKSLRKRPIPENDKTGTEEKKINLHYVQDSQKEEKKKSETIQETPVECSKQKRMEKITRLLNDSKNHGNRILVFSWWVNFDRWYSLQQTKWLGRNDWEWCLWALQTDNNA